MIIDFHTHAFPDSLAPTALAKLRQGSNLSEINQSDGTVGGLISKMDEWGIDRAVICNIATNAHQMKKVNDFAISTDNKENKITALGSINPDAPADEIEEEFIRLKSAGIKGIKIHPDFQKHDIDEECYEPIFEGAIKYGMFVTTHAGLDRVSPEHVHARPEAILNVITKYPKLTLIAAHMGAKEMWNDSMDILSGKNVYFDTAVVRLCGMTNEQAEKIIKIHGADKILFGSDCPWSNSKFEADFIKGLNISDADKEKILHGNAERLLNIR